MSIGNVGTNDGGNYGGIISNYGNQILGKNDFLNLLVTQLRFQNPVSPMENTEFIAQLAQFSALEQMQNVNQNFQDQMLLIQSTNNALVTTLIGKDILASGNSVYLGDKGKTDIKFDLDSKAQVTIKIYDENNVLVKTIDPQECNEGFNEISWNGENKAGSRAAKGVYTYKIEAKNSRNEDVNTTSYTSGEVTGVRFSQGNAYLMLNEIEVPLAYVLEILNRDDGENSSGNQGNGEE
jgi:flagellar basal-body rod modification protein FlgD